MVTSVASSPEFDFVSRFFAPGAGIDEDPVTGSAHCCLGPHWRVRLGKNEFLAYQASDRGGVLRVRVDAGAHRVRLGGRAVTILVGELVAD
jgi:predicted PhzF superfamily epimerase YddE/YHI9